MHARTVQAEPHQRPDTHAGLSLGSFTLDGYSLGGVETTVSIPEWRLAIDVGRGPMRLVRATHIALTHTHMDHAGGLPYLLALRKLFRMGPPIIYLPAQVAAAFREMMAAWDRLQNFASDYTLVPVEPGARYRLRRDLDLIPFRTYHGLPSCGYTIERTVRKLKAAYQGLSGPEIARRREAGEPLIEAVRQPLLSVTGDTLPEVLDKQPQILDSETLVIECTFLDDRKDYAACRAGGHVHLKDLLDRVEALATRRIVLSHFSQIYGWHELPDLLAPLAERLPGRLFAFPTAPDHRAIGPLGAVAAEPGATAEPGAAQ